MKIGVIVAMDKELRQLKDLFNDVDVRVVKCGIGKVNAALGAQRMIDDYKPDVIISSGCAGGVGDDIEVQDVVVSNRLVYHDVYCGAEVEYGQVQRMPRFYEVDKTLLEKACGLRCGVKIHPGLIASGDWFVDSKDVMKKIVDHFPEVKAVDIESCAIAHTCYINNVPFISFRVVSDIPLRGNNAAVYNNFWDTVAGHSFEVTKKYIESILN